MQADKNNLPAQSLNIELTEEIAEGDYANFAIIGHSPHEFVFDFVRVLPNMGKGKVKSRIIMHPQQAKMLLHALRENIRLYEQSFGTIKDETQQMPPVQFNTPKGQA